MAEWKKVVVSGSSAELNSLTLDTALVAASGGTGIDDLTGQEGKVLKVNSGATGFELGTDSSEFTSAGISGSLGANADLIRSLTAAGISGSSAFTAAGISGSLGANADVIRSLTAAGISGSLGANADLIRSLTAAGISGSSAFTAAGISGSLGANADVIRSLTAAGISGSLGANADLIRSLTAAGISGSSAFTAAGISGSLGANADVIRSLTAAGISGSSANKLPLAGGTLTGALTGTTATFTGNTVFGDGAEDRTTVNGELLVNGTASFAHSDNLAIKDKYILINSGSTGTGDGGIVVQSSGTNGIGELVGFDQNVTGRWGITSSFDADTTSDFIPSAFMAVVVTDTVDDPNATGIGSSTKAAAYTKAGNMYIDTDAGSDGIWIYN